MIFTIKPLFVPSFERRFHREVQEVVVWASLEADTTDNLVLCNTLLILQEEVMFKHREIGVYSEIGLAQMNKDCDLKDRIRVEMSWINFVIMEETTEEFAGRKVESSLEEGGQNHNFICVGCWDVSIFCRPSLEHDTIGDVTPYYKE
jgi:hypothetical protein